MHTIPPSTLAFPAAGFDQLCLPFATLRCSRARNARVVSQVMEWLVHGSWGEEQFYQSFFIYGCGGEFGLSDAKKDNW